MAVAQARIAPARGLASGPRAEESACIRRAQEGDVAAFEELVRTHQKRVLGIVAGILRWSEDIEDIGQQVFLKVYLAIRRFDGRSSFSTWLYKIAVNETYDYLRKKKARKLVYESDLSLDQEERLSQKPPEEPTRAALDHADDRQAVERLLSELAPEERLMIVLKEVEGYSVEEISRAMNMNPNTVKVRMFRARRRLSDLYKRRYGPSRKAVTPANGRT
ncbi:MAG TPA: sigma-70 family RNA polymerase sigma factor [Candidatus Acidoferrales bacterium]|nr:sigma-70 family RNA polymerase sigma factor [Candidatus Acidoferrales bacterium]